MSKWKNNIIGIQNMDPNELRPNPNNIKDHGEYQKRVMSGIVEEVGIIDTVLYNQRTKRLVDGHMRVQLAIENGEKTIPVTIIDIPEEDESKVLLVLDMVGGLSTIRSESIRKLTESVDIANATARDFVQGIAKKNGVDTSRLNDKGDNTEQEDAADKDSNESGFEINDGDMFDIINEENGAIHKLAIGNNTDSELWRILFDGQRPSLCVTSPPYNQKINKFKPSGMQKENTSFVDRMSSSYDDDIPEDEYQRLQIEMINRIADCILDNGSIFYNHKIRYREKRIIHPIEWIMRTKCSIRQEIIWDRGGSITLNARMFIPCDERIYWLKKDDDFYFNDETEIKSWSTIWRFGAHNDIRVSAAFPYELPYRCILACSEQGDIVFDPYSGSGTTIVAANRTDRIGYGIEIDHGHADKSLSRFIKDGLVINKR